MGILNLAVRNVTEAELIAGCIHGNRVYQRELYNIHAPVMFSLCIRYAPDYHTAEDFLQEGFLKVYRNLHKYSGVGSFEGWLKRVFVNYCIEQCRKNNHRVLADDIELAGDYTASENVLSKLCLEDLMKLVQSLPTGYRTVFNLYVIEGFSSKEIAEMLNITESNLRSQLTRAKASLRKKLENT